MAGLWKQLRTAWDDWCGDREMENSIRRHLTEHGYFGNTAKFRAVRLVAVQRPGWLQIYRFEATARVNPGESPDEAAAEAVYEDLFGLVQDDARKNISHVRVFTQESQRRELFLTWSDGLICLRGAKGLVTTLADANDG